MAPWFPPPLKPIKAPSCNARPCLAPLGVAPSMVPLDPSTFHAPTLRAFADCTTHEVALHFTPAAFPRCASTPGTIDIPQGLLGKERRTWVKQEASKLVTEKRSLERDLARGRGVVAEGPTRVVGRVGLWNAVLRIRRKHNPPRGTEGVTLVLTHANGSHKETWEVALRRLIDLTERTDSTIRIADVWILECVDHGDSALVNGAHIPRLADRSDYARDVANFCLHYMPPQSTIGLPTILQRLTKNPRAPGYSQKRRKVIGVGQSLGGDAMVLCALSYPSIFEALVISETTLFPVHLNSEELALLYVSQALGRRGDWSSREEARKSLEKTSLYASLHPGVLQSYVDHALYKQEGVVKLKCKPEWEASQFNELLSMNEGWEMLPSLDNRVRLHWIMGGLDCASSIIGGVEIARDLVWRRAANSSNVRIPDAGHLVVQEKPMEFAKALAEFMESHAGDQLSLGTTKARL